MDYVASIVIPTFNRPDYLRRSIDSAIDQTVPCEVIVVDHGSSAATAKVALSYGQRIRYVRREMDSGPILPWLDGVFASTCEIVKLLYDDDWLEESFIESTSALLAKDVGFVFCAAQLINQDGSPSKILFDRLFPSSAIYGKHAHRQLVARKMISPSAMLMRRQDWIDGLHPGKLFSQRTAHHGAGPDHWVKLLCLTRYPKFAFFDGPLVNFQAHSGSITTSAVSTKVGNKALGAVYSEIYAIYKLASFAQAIRAPELTKCLLQVSDQVREILARAEKATVAAALSIGARKTWRRS